MKWSGIFFLVRYAKASLQNAAGIFTECRTAHCMWSYFLLICQLHKIWKETTRITCIEFHICLYWEARAERLHTEQEERKNCMVNNLANKRKEKEILLASKPIKLKFSILYMSHTVNVGQPGSTLVFNLRIVPRCKAFPVCLTEYFGNEHLPFSISCC